MALDRFTVNLSPGRDAEETANRTMEELIRLTQLINAAKIPIMVGPNDNIPEGMAVGQPVIDWSSGTSVVKTWDGKQLI